MWLPCHACSEAAPAAWRAAFSQATGFASLRCPPLTSGLLLQTKSRPRRRQYRQQQRPPKPECRLRRRTRPTCRRRGGGGGEGGQASGARSGLVGPGRGLSGPPEASNAGTSPGRELQTRVRHRRSRRAVDGASSDSDESGVTRSSPVRLRAAALPHGSAADFPSPATPTRSSVCLALLLFALVLLCQPQKWAEADPVLSYMGREGRKAKVQPHSVALAVTLWRQWWG